MYKKLISLEFYIPDLRAPSALLLFTHLGAKGAHSLLESSIKMPIVESCNRVCAVLHRALQAFTMKAFNIFSVALIKCLRRLTFDFW